MTGDEKRAGALGVFSEELGGEGNEVVRADEGGVEVRRDGLGMATTRGPTKEKYFGWFMIVVKVGDAEEGMRLSA
jgi:hypothetical protein